MINLDHVATADLLAFAKTTRAIDRNLGDNSTREQIQAAVREDLAHNHYVRRSFVHRFGLGLNQSFTTSVIQGPKSAQKSAATHPAAVPQRVTTSAAPAIALAAKSPIPSQAQSATAIPTASEPPIAEVGKSRVQRALDMCKPRKTSSHQGSPIKDAPIARSRAQQALDLVFGPATNSVSDVPFAKAAPGGVTRVQQALANRGLGSPEKRV